MLGERCDEIPTRRTTFRRKTEPELLVVLMSTQSKHFSSVIFNGLVQNSGTFLFIYYVDQRITGTVLGV